jgi:hypothetical protein
MNAAASMVGEPAALLNSMEAYSKGMENYAYFMLAGADGSETSAKDVVDLVNSDLFGAYQTGVDDDLGVVMTTNPEHDVDVIFDGMDLERQRLSQEYLATPDGEEPEEFGSRIEFEEWARDIARSRFVPVEHGEYALVHITTSKGFTAAGLEMPVGANGTVTYKPEVFVQLSHGADAGMVTPAVSEFDIIGQAEAARQ